jgi:TatD DNase family protein
MLVDSHAHLDSAEFGGALDEVIERALAAGVGEILNVGYDPGSLDVTLGLTERYDCICGSLGIHPHNAKRYSAQLEEELRKKLLLRKVLAVGEIGLDYYRDLSPRDVQRDVFRRQIGVALSVGKPIVVHCRDAFDDVMSILGEEGAGEAGGVFHAFSGGLDEAREVLDLGFHLGIGGPITYKNSRLPEVVSHVPSGSLLIETDCPYLPPVPHRGERNEPAYVALVAEKLAEVLGITLQDIERASEANYGRLFHPERETAPAVAYALKRNIYVNVTSSCTNDCVFCPRGRFGMYLCGYDLRLDRDPTPTEMADAVRGLAGDGDFEEIVFCGYGEPTCRLDAVIEAAEGLAGIGLPLRLDTNGQGNLIHRRNIVPEIERVMDSVSISLNAPDAETYERLCRPDFGGRAFGAVVDFIEKTAASRMSCTVTALDYEGVDLDACRALVESIPGAEFRVRHYHYNG